MKCFECGEETTKVVATRKAPYHFTQSGLKNVYLAGITVEVCEKCGIESPIIPQIEQLHKAIASVLAGKPDLLSGEEIRFLRKIAGFPANKFAALLMMDAATLSRAENGHQSLGASSDKLARAVAMAAISVEAAKDVLIKIAEKMEHQHKSRLPLFFYEKDWKAAA